MRRLLLLRHGEAEAIATGGSDIERALTAQGRNEVVSAADVMTRAQLCVDRVLVSSARRTLETAAIMAERLTFPRPAEPQEALYLAPPPGLLQSLARCHASCHQVMLIGHNPGLSDLVERLTDGRQRLTLRTAGLCLLSFASDGWRDIAADIADEFEWLR
jgi:phosphohistidine phosphatase